MLCAVFPLAARDVGVTILDGELGMPLEGAEIRSYDGTSYQGDGEGRVVLTVPDDRAVVIRGTYPGYDSERLTIDTEYDEFVLELHLTGTLEAEELVLEESRDREPEDAADIDTVPEEGEIQGTGEPEIIEDTTNPIEPPPQAGYSGPFNAAPGLREGRPGDLVAVMDGFYIKTPYHWGGEVSIFDPRILESARLTHGVFSVASGHAVSGLLELAIKKPSPEHLEIELDLSTAMAVAGLSFPLAGRGGLMFTGRLSYYDPVILAARGLFGVSGLEFLKPAVSISTAPYIRDLALSSAYRVTDKLELSLTGFLGADGVAYREQADPLGSLEIAGDRLSYQVFGRLGLSYNPRNDMSFNAGLGAAYRRSELEGRTGGGSIFLADALSTVQGRAELEWNLGRGLLMSLGLEGLYLYPEGEVEVPVGIKPPGVDYTRLQSLSGAAYVLANYTSPGRRFGAELGLRLDHVFVTGQDFSGDRPVLSPRLNLDFGLLENRGPLDSLSLVLGLGLFSAANAISDSRWAQDLFGEDARRPDQALTGAGGLRLEFSGAFSLDVEGYYTHVTRRTYAFFDAASSGWGLYADGQGRLWGLDLRLAKLESRFLDGWIAYSFSRARYREPGLPEDPFVNIVNAVSRDWHQLPFHRFHALYVALNIRPAQRFVLGTRLGFVSYALVDPDERSFSIPADIKFSFLSHSLHGKARWEFYVAVGNVFSADPAGNTTFNPYTGKEDTWSMSLSYDMPVPVPSFGFRWSY
ncbi:MAG: TonB-dependent receptor [Treponema sp.]|nr:TonB-dependent receptor [Treponema sp.]